MGKRTFGILLAAVASVGCYHATIDTGAAPSTQVEEKAFASGWIYGLVPPSTVSTAAKCPDGVAKVETQLSFVNQLVSAITFGIFTPMSIKVTCAAKKVGAVQTSAPDVTVGADAGPDGIRSAFATAATKAVATGAPVTVQLQAQH